MLPAVPGSLGEKAGLTELSVGRKAVLRAWESGSLGVIAVVRAAAMHLGNVSRDSRAYRQKVCQIPLRHFQSLGAAGSGPSFMVCTYTPHEPSLSAQRIPP